MSGKLPLSVNIRPDTRKILDQGAGGLNYGGRPPIGQIIDEMTSYFQFRGWDEIEKAIFEKSPRAITRPKGEGPRAEKERLVHRLRPEGARF